MLWQNYSGKIREFSGIAVRKSVRQIVINLPALPAEGCAAERAHPGTEFHRKYDNARPAPASHKTCPRNQEDITAVKRGKLLRAAIQDLSQAPDSKLTVQQAVSPNSVDKSD